VRRAVTLFILLNLMDLITTLCLLGFHPRDFYEFNPLARLCYAIAGWAGMGGLKFASVALATAIAGYISYHSPLVAIRLLDAGSLLVGGAFIYSLALYASGGLMQEVMIGCGLAITGTVIFVICHLVAARDQSTGRIEELVAENEKLSTSNQDLSQQLKYWKGLAQGHSSVKAMMTEGNT